MAYSLSLSGAPDQDEAEIFFLCSIGAWEAVSVWARARGLDSLSKLVEAGELAGTDRLGEDLAEALEVNPAEDKGVRATLERLAELVGVGHPDETATIVD